MESTQISIGGFGGGVTAKDLADYLENNIENIGTVARCRLKTSITPPFSYPKFISSTNFIVHNPARVLPHGFVQFLAPVAVKETVEMAKQEKSEDGITEKSGNNFGFFPAKTH